MSLCQNAMSFESTGIERLRSSERTDTTHISGKLISSSSVEVIKTLVHKYGLKFWSSKMEKFTIILQIIIGSLTCLLAAGIVFGYAALKPILVEEHTYRDYCTKEELRHNVRVCLQQEIRLNFMFTVATIGTNVSSLLVGAILDKYGPRVCGQISSILLSIGALMFAFGSDVPFDGYLIGYLFLAVGGCFTFLPSFHLSNTLPKRSGLIMAIISGAFDSSSALFLVYKTIYFRTGKKFEPKKFFIAYLIVPILIFLAQSLYMPSLSYRSIVERERDRQSEETVVTDVNINERTALLTTEPQEHPFSSSSEIDDHLDSGSVKKRIKEQESKSGIYEVWGVMHSKTVREQISSPWFILMCLFTILQMIRINYFIATIRPQYEYILGSHSDALEVNAVFDVALPIGGLLTVPFTGMVLDTISTTSLLVLLLILTTIIGCLGCLPYKWAAYSNIILFVIYRPFYYAAVSDFMAKVFGFKTFGIIYGLLICISGIFNITVNGLDQLRYRIFYRNPIPINIFLTVIALVVGTILSLYIGMKSNIMRRKGAEFAEEHADETENGMLLI